MQNWLEIVVAQHLSKGFRGKKDDFQKVEQASFQLLEDRVQLAFEGAHRPRHRSTAKLTKLTKPSQHIL